MRNTCLITVVLFSMATAAFAADRKNVAQPESQQAEQTGMARNGADGSMEQATSTKSNCTPKRQKQSQRKNQKDDRQGDPQGSQNQVEYGGAG
jgi:hypothetical protein